MATKIDILALIGHIWPMDFTLHDQMTGLGKRIKARRLALDLTQQAAAAKAGVAHRTWRRVEAEGKASIEDLVRAAIALRCDEGIAALFPEMVASSMDELLAQQRKASTPLRQRAGAARS
jgi:transcriptional regulator with XRE-family HTH domain